MNIRKLGIALVTATLFSGTAMAQTQVQNDTQRDVNQQQRIENGLQSGQLNTQEAGKLEKQEQHIDKMEARDMKNGSISPAEQAKLNAAQNHVSQDINKDKHNATIGNPNSVSSQRMQANVQRNVNQQQRVEYGEKSGQLTNREAGKLERGQAHVDRKEARAAANGHVGAGEQARIRNSENHQSRKIFRKKHNARSAG